MKKGWTILSVLLAAVILHALLYWKSSVGPQPAAAGQVHLSPVAIPVEMKITPNDLGMDKTGSFPVLKFQQNLTLESDHIELAFDGKTIRFDSCSFPEDFLPYYYSYRSPVVFSNCTFGKPGEYADDHPPFGFMKNHFQNSCQFEQNTFHRDIYMDECEFDGKLQIDADNHFSDGDLTIMNSIAHKGIQLKSSLPSMRKVQSLPKNIAFDQDTIHGTLNLKGYDFSSCGLSFSDTWIDTLNLESATFGSPVSLRAGSLQTKYRLEAWTTNPFLRFFLLPYCSPYEQVKTALNISEVDLDKISLDYSLFKLYFPNNSLLNDRVAVYRRLLDKYTHTGEQLNYEQVDIDLHNEQGGISNDLSRLWWNYGYGKQRIFIWSLLFLFVFAIINFFNLNAALAAYDIQSVSKWLNDPSNNKKNRTARKALASLLYTSGLFFGIKLDYEKLVFTKLTYSIFILFQFLLGLVCTGFIVNLIFSK